MDQSITNYKGDQFIHACVGCGNVNGLAMLAHRNEDEFITGIIFVCTKCINNFENVKLNIYHEYKSKV